MEQTLLKNSEVLAKGEPSSLWNEYLIVWFVSYSYPKISIIQRNYRFRIMSFLDSIHRLESLV